MDRALAGQSKVLDSREKSGDLCLGFEDESDGKAAAGDPIGPCRKRAESEVSFAAFVSQCPCRHGPNRFNAGPSSFGSAQGRPRTWRRLARSLRWAGPEARGRDPAGRRLNAQASPVKWNSLREPGAVAGRRAGGAPAPRSRRVPAFGRPSLSCMARGRSRWPESGPRGPRNGPRSLGGGIP